jgi:uncharacterized membrane protein HdeD (DUF308 family)
MSSTDYRTVTTADYPQGVWQATLFVGALTFILGVIVCFNPTGTLNFIAVVVGILMILSGLFNLVRVFNAHEHHRVWLGIAGLVWIVFGVVMIRHLDLTLAVVGLLVGLVWIVQGIAALMAGFSGQAREGKAFWIVLGLISIVAGIVVVSVPVSSLTALAVLLGIWFVIIGLLEVAGAFMLRGALKS